MSSSPVTFNGTSTFSSDFQQVITRAVGIASLPIAQLNSEKTRLQSQSTELGSLGSVFSSLQSSISGLQTALGVGSFSTSVSDGSVASASVSSGATAGSYSLEVTSLGAFTNTLSAGGLTTVSDPSTQNITSDSSFTLSVNGVDTTITPAAQTLESLANAINSQPGLNVQASIVNIGSSGTPDYRLAVQSTKLGLIPLELNDASGNLTITLAPPAALATYKVNNLSTPISSDSRTITLAPGLSVNLLGQSTPGTATTITVSQSTAAVSNALGRFVSAYNAASDELAKNRGVGGGALTGQSAVFALEQSLRNITNYSSGSAGVSSLTDLGIAFDRNGHLSFDNNAFSSGTTGQLTALANFLGNPASSGFLHNASSVLTGIQDPIDGLITAASNSVTTQIAANDSQTAADQDRVDRLTTALTHQISAADAAIATLQQQVSQVTALFQAQTSATLALKG